MSLFKPFTLLVQRSTGSYVEGEWVVAADKTFYIACSVQPITGERLKTLREGKRIAAANDIFTDMKLRPADPLTGTPGDIVTYDGYKWEVIEVHPWQNGLISHYACVVSRQKEIVTEEIV
jgi:hypothetical protein